MLKKVSHLSFWNCIMPRTRCVLVWEIVLYAVTCKCFLCCYWIALSWHVCMSTQRRERMLVFWNGNQRLSLEKCIASWPVVYIMQERIHTLWFGNVDFVWQCSNCWVMATKSKLDLNGMRYGPMVGFWEHDDKYCLSTNNSNLILLWFHPIFYLSN
jgi:hypothetical protein